MEQAELLELMAHPAEFFERLRKEGKMCAVMGDFVIPREIHKKTWRTILSCQRRLQSLRDVCHQSK